MNSRIIKIIVILVILIVLANIVTAIFPGIKGEAINMKCRVRLNRLGRAVSFYLIDNHRKAFPTIINPEIDEKCKMRFDGNGFIIPRKGSIALVLRDCISDNRVQPKAETNKIDKSSEIYKTNYNNMLAMEIKLTICPAINLETEEPLGLEYLYHGESLKEKDPRKMGYDYGINKKSYERVLDPVTYFSCQTTEDGELPHLHEGERCRFVSKGFAEVKDVTAVDLLRLEKKLEAIEKKNERKAVSEWTHNLPFLRSEVARYRRALKKNPNGIRVSKPTSKVFSETTDGIEGIELMETDEGE